MISLANVVSAVIKNGTRILKVMQYGAKTADECGPFGDDSSPLKDMVAVYAQTEEIGDPIIIGYINEKQLAQPGEKRFYSLKADGSLATSIWLKNNGTIELAGNMHNLVRFTPLNAGLQATTSQINAELIKIATAITALGGAYIPLSITNDITASKINEIKSI